MAKEINNVRKKKSQFKSYLKYFLIFLLVFTVVSGIIIYQNVVEGLPSLEQLENPKQSLATVIYSSDGVEIGRFFRESRTETRMDSIPVHLVQALISTEDKKFREHWGVDLSRIVKGIIKTIFLGKKQGGSTITQQLAKNLYEFKVSNENFYETITRKIREVITAVQIEKTYTKDEILEMYFNNSYFGRGAYGISMAARVFFNKSVVNLTIPESAVLVALLKSSVLYDPERKPENSMQRRNLVMNEMREDDVITDEQYEKFSEMPLNVFIKEAKSKFYSDIAPHFVEYIRQQMEDLSDKHDFNLYEDGLSIYTSLDSRMQKIANKSVKTQLDQIQTQFDKLWSWEKNINTLDALLDKAIKQTHRYQNAKSSSEKRNIYNLLKLHTPFVDSVKKVAQTIEVGFVVLDSKTGDIRAMVGGRDVEKGRGLNHVTQIKRQPGSSFKPIVYTVALDNGLYPSYPILNQPFDYNGWSPSNFEGDFGGYLTLREAIKNSVNLVAARLIIEGHVPLDQVGEYAKKMGIKNKLNLFPAIALGASEVVPLELTSVFGTIANRGIYNEPISILKITDKNGLLVESFSSTSHEAISEETAYLITSLLQTVINEGTGIRIRSIHKFYRPAAGKTGTNGDYKDAWFMGFTPQLTAGVWVGFDDQRIAFTGAYGQGAKVAAPIWGEFMREVYETIKLPMEGFNPPASGDIVSVSFCKNTIYDTGNPKLYTDGCSSGKVTDIINIKDIPDTYNRDRDTTRRNSNKYRIIDKNSHEATEITD